jgi:hypothetical protein
VADEKLSGIVPANGTLRITWFPPSKGAIVKQVGIKAPNVGGGSVGNIYKNTSPITPFVATGDAPSGEPYVDLSRNDKLVVEWTSATVGAPVEITVFYDDLAVPK